MTGAEHIHPATACSSGRPADVVVPPQNRAAPASPRGAHAGDAYAAPAGAGAVGGSVSQAPSPLLSLPSYLWDDIYALLPPSALAAVPCALPAVPEPLYEAAFLRLGLPTRSASFDARTALRQAIALARSPMLWPQEFAPPGPPACWDKAINPWWGDLTWEVMAHGDLVLAPILNLVRSRRFLPLYYDLQADNGAAVYNTQEGKFKHVFGLMAKEMIPAEEGIFSCSDVGIRLTGYDNKRIWAKKHQYVVSGIILGRTCVFSAGGLMHGQAWNRKTGAEIEVHAAELRPHEYVLQVSYQLGGFIAGTNTGNVFFWPEERLKDKPQRISLPGGCILGLHATEHATLIANYTAVRLYGPLLSGAVPLQCWSFAQDFPSERSVSSVFLIDDTAFWLARSAGTLYRAQPGCDVERFPGIKGSPFGAAYANGRIYFNATSRSLGSFGPRKLAVKLG